LHVTSKVPFYLCFSCTPNFSTFLFLHSLPFSSLSPTFSVLFRPSAHCLSDSLSSGPLSSLIQPPTVILLVPHSSFIRASRWLYFINFWKLLLKAPSLPGIHSNLNHNPIHRCYHCIVLFVITRMSIEI